MNFHRTSMVDVAQPSLGFVALCAFVTEGDLHYLRRLGRSCARCADLFWARDGRVRHRALVYDSARVRSLNDDDKTLVDATRERLPIGALAFCDIIGDALEHSNLQFSDLLLLARRTMQDDSLVLLYLLLYGIITDSTRLVEQIVNMGESWRDNFGLADPPSLVHPKIDALGAPVLNDEDAEAAAAMEFVISQSRQASDETTTTQTTTSTHSYETDTTTTSGDFTPRNIRDLHDALQRGDIKAAQRALESFIEGERAVSEDDNTEEEQQSRANRDFFSAWWPALGIHNTPVLRKYFFYIYPSRTDLVFKDSDSLQQMTLAERLMALAAIWRSNNSAQMLLSVPVFRCNTSVSVFFSCCDKQTATMIKAAQDISGLEKSDLKVLLPEGSRRINAAINNPCKSLEAHFRTLNDNAVFCENVACFVDPKRRDTLDRDDLAALKNCVQLPNNHDDDGDGGDGLTTREPQTDFDISSALPDLVDYHHAFWSAVRNNNEKEMQAIMTRHSIDVCKEHNYAVRLAAHHNAADVLEALLKLPHVDPSDDGNSAICVAVSAGAAEAVEVLLKQKSVRPGINNNFSICRATELNKEQIVKMLMASDQVDINARESTPLINALRNAALMTVVALRRDKRLCVQQCSIGRLRAVADDLRMRLAADDGDPMVLGCAALADEIVAELNKLTE
jgi:hypothetical protein